MFVYESSILHSYQHLNLSFCVYISPSDRSIVVFHSGFHFNFLNDIKDLNKCLFAVCILSLVKYLFRCFALLKHCCLLLLKYESCLYILDTSLSLAICLANIFFQSDFLKCLSKSRRGTSLVAQWLRICLPVQGTRVQSLVREDPTCSGATKAVRHNY